MNKIVRKSAMHGESGYERQRNDAYWTEEWVVQALLKVWKPAGNIVEPCAGAGNIVEALFKAGYGVKDAFDIVDYGFPLTRKIDFYDVTADMLPERPVILTNPPYDRVPLFIKHALEVTRVRGGEVALLLRAEFSAGITRRHLFTEYPWFAKVELQKRPRWKGLAPQQVIIDPKTGKPKKEASPRHNFAWYIWSWSRPVDHASIFLSY